MFKNAANICFNLDFTFKSKWVQNWYCYDNRHLNDGCQVLFYFPQVNILLGSMEQWTIVLCKMMAQPNMLIHLEYQIDIGFFPEQKDKQMCTCYTNASIGKLMELRFSCGVHG